MTLFVTLIACLILTAATLGFNLVDAIQDWAQGY